MIIVGVITNDLGIIAGSEYMCHLPLLSFGGKRWRYKNGTVLWYEPYMDEERLEVESYLNKKGYIVKNQFTMKEISDIYYHHYRE